MRNEKIVIAFIQDELNVKIMLKILKLVRDEEILANTNKTLRIILRDDHEIHKLLKKNKDDKKKELNQPGVFLGFDERMLGQIINGILEELNVHNFSELVLVEATAAVLNFVKHHDLIRFILPENLTFLVNIVMEHYDKPRVLAIQCLQHISQRDEYKKYITQLGADDILEIKI